MPINYNLNFSEELRSVKEGFPAFVKDNSSKTYAHF
jgi:hypothetical protein